MNEAEQNIFYRMARSTTLWRCGRAVKTNLLHWRNLALNTRKWLWYESFQIPKRSSMHPGPRFNMMVHLHLQQQKDHHCHLLCLQRTSLEDELKYWISAKSKESAVIQPKVFRIAHQKDFPTLDIGFTAMVIWIFQLRVKVTAMHIMNWIRSYPMPL